MTHLKAKALRTLACWDWRF